MNLTLRQAGVTAAAALLAAGVAAQGSPYVIGGSVAYSHQSNTLGLADGASLAAGSDYTSQSDNVTSLALIGGLDQPIGRQRVFGDLTLRSNRYARNELLNHQSYSVTGGVDWQTIERISGNLTLKSNRDLVRFSSTERPTGGRNLVTTRQADASARIGVVTRYTFEAGGNWRSVDYSDREYDGRDFRQQTAFIGARYWPSGTNYLGLTLRNGSGRYPGFRTAANTTAGDGFDRRDVDLSLSLQTSGSSTLFARTSYSRINHELPGRADYAGFTGLFRGTFNATAKLQFAAEVARDRGQEIDILLFDPAVGVARVESARLATVARLRAAFAASTKTEVHANASATRRTLAQTSLFTNVQESGRERSTQFGLGASWTPTRTSRIGCDVSRDQRRSDIASARLNISANSTTCFAQLTLQP